MKIRYSINIGPSVVACIGSLIFAISFIYSASYVAETGILPHRMRHWSPYWATRFWILGSLLFGGPTILLIVSILKSTMQEWYIIINRDFMIWPKGVFKEKGNVLKLSEIEDLKIVSHSNAIVLEITAKSKKYQLLKNTLSDKKKFDEIYDHLCRVLKKNYRRGQAGL